MTPYLELCSSTVTLGTLLLFSLLFGLFDTFLKFLLHDFLEEFFFGDEHEVIEVVDRLSVVGGVHDLAAFVE